MKCEDCLISVEDYFDGGLENETAERVGAHLSACAECAAALEALEAEQALYMRYDRELEVTPALWEGVRAGIARLESLDDEALTALPSNPTRPASLRGRLEALFAALTQRPVLASSLALILLGVTFGALLFRSVDSPDRGQSEPQQIATGGPAPSTVFSPTGVSRKDEANRTAEVTGEVVEQPVAIESGMSETAAPASIHKTRRAGVLDASVSAPETAEDLPPDPDHLEVAGADFPSTAEQSSFDVEDEVASAASLLGPEEKEVARHVERAQALLRSFRNTRSTDGASSANVAYERELARRLLRENLALQLDAEEAGDKTTGRVLDAIQPFLRDIANMRDEPSRDEVRSIKERMRKTEIVAALQVY